jgi:hypothetical protein
MHYGGLLLDRFDVALFRVDPENSLASKALHRTFVVVIGLAQIQFVPAAQTVDFHFISLIFWAKDLRKEPTGRALPRGEPGHLTGAGSFALVPDLERVGSPRRDKVYPGPQGAATISSPSFSQTLQEDCLFGLDFPQTDFQFCHPSLGGRPFGSAASLFDFQARDLQVRPMGKTDAIHSTGNRTNGPQTS